MYRFSTERIISDTSCLSRLIRSLILLAFCVLGSSLRLAQAQTVECDVAKWAETVALDLGAEQTILVGHQVSISAILKVATTDQAAVCASEMEDAPAEWRLVKPDGGQTTLTSKSGLMTQFTADTPGVYVVRLTLSQGQPVVSAETRRLAVTTLPVETSKSPLAGSRRVEPAEAKGDAVGPDAPNAPSVLLPPLPSEWVSTPGSTLTLHRQAATEFDGKVYVFSANLDGRLMFQTYDPVPRAWLRTDAWTEVPGGGITDAAPAVAATRDTLYLFVKGLDKQVWVNKKSAGSGPTSDWSGWGVERLPVGQTNTSVAAVATRDNVVYVYRRDPNGKLYKTRRQSSGWLSWLAIPVAGPSSQQAPSAAYDDTRHTVYLFSPGQVAGFNLMWMTEIGLSATGENWRGWCVIGGGDLSNEPVGAAVLSGQLYITYKTQGTNRIMLQTYKQSRRSCGTWSGGVELKGMAETAIGPVITRAGSILMVFSQQYAPLPFLPALPRVFHHFAWPSDLVPQVTTRGQFDTDTGNRLAPYDAYEYDMLGVIPGRTPGTSCPTELAIAVHGWDNTVNSAQDRFQRARWSLRQAGYTGPVIGYSWDSNTGSWANTVGFDTGKAIADANAFKLANFIDDYKAACRATRLHLMGHSLGTRVVLAAIRALNRDSYFWWNNDLAGVQIEDVHLLGAAVDNETPQTNETYGPGIAAEVGRLVNYFADDDDVLQFAYRAEERDNALGLTGIEDRRRMPVNYRDEWVGYIVRDDHFIYWGYRAEDREAAGVTTGVMDKVRLFFR